MPEFDNLADALREVDRLRRLLRDTREALKPFVSERDPKGRLWRICEEPPASIPADAWYHPSVACNPTAGDFRKALRILREASSA